jgi:hypothetical protein
MSEQLPSNLDRLEKADVGDPSTLNERERELIETLTPEEVDVLIRIRQKLGRSREESPYSRMRFPF